MSLAAILLKLLPQIIDFLGSLLNPNKPGPSLERMSLLVNILLVVLIGYVCHGAYIVYERNTEQVSTINVQKTELANIKQDLEDAKAAAFIKRSETEHLQLMYDQCVSQCPKVTLGTDVPKDEEVVDTPPTKPKHHVSKPTETYDRTNLLLDINSD
jgi:hypothetical protein